MLAARTDFQTPGPRDSRVLWSLGRAKQNFRVDGGLSLAIMVDHRISPGDQAESKGSDKGEGGEEEHLERGHAKTGRGDKLRNRRVLHSRIRHQHPEVADRD